MKRELTQSEIEKRFAEINANEAEEPTAEDLAAISAASSEELGNSITLDAYKLTR